MIANVVIVAAILGYSGYIVYRVIHGKVSGKGNPFSCTGECASCGAACRSARSGEELYREIKQSMEQSRS